MLNWQTPKRYLPPKDLADAEKVCLPSSSGHHRRDDAQVEEGELCHAVALSGRGFGGNEAERLGQVSRQIVCLAGLMASCQSALCQLCPTKGKQNYWVRFRIPHLALVAPGTCELLFCSATMSFSCVLLSEITEGVYNVIRGT